MDVDTAMALIEASGPKPQTTFVLSMMREPEVVREPAKAMVPVNLVLPSIGPGVIDRLVRASRTNR